MTDTPWQPGPWSIGNRGVQDANGKLVFRDPCGPNVKLEVLAPEMAAAILRCAPNCPQTVDDEVLTALADKLREIGRA